jgi:hypothetical protein
MPYIGHEVRGKGASGEQILNQLGLAGYFRVFFGREHIGAFLLL